MLETRTARIQAVRAGNQILSIVLPAYNEEARILETLNALTSLTRLQLEIIVVCDGCTAATESIVQAWNPPANISTSVISYFPNQGKGYAVRKGILSASGSIVGFMDADGSTDLSALIPVVDALTSDNADVVVASRRMKESVLIPAQPWHRQVLGQCFSVTTQFCLRLPVRDTQCGFKFFRHTVARDLFESLECEGFGFDVEVLARAQWHGYRIREIPVIWRDAPGSKVSAIKDGLRMLVTVGRTAFHRSGSVGLNGSALRERNEQL